MNSWNFTGNLGNPAEQRYLPNGDSIVSFNVAVKSGYGEKASTTWVRCSMFGKRGEAVLTYLVKGQLVGVCGEATLRDWQDKEGAKRSSLEVRVNDLSLLGKSQGSDEPQRPTQTEKPAQTGGGSSGFSDFESDIPFASCAIEHDVIARRLAGRKLRA